jgi:hypothetical protein
MVLWKEWGNCGHKRKKKKVELEVKFEKVMRICEKCYVDEHVKEGNINV